MYTQDEMENSQGKSQITANSNNSFVTSIKNLESKMFDKFNESYNEKSN